MSVFPKPGKSELDNYNKNNPPEKQLEEMLRESSKVVFFGGAGVSTESGIPDFRSANGIYSEKYGNLSPEMIISRSFFDRDPEMFYDFYCRKLIYKDAEPNAAHKKLAELEAAFEGVGKKLTVITQNIDGLHQSAGSKNVIELHGSVLRNFCMKCHKAYGLEAVLDGGKSVPRCECGGIIKPDVVLYEESLNDSDINNAVKAISEADMLIIAGTSLIVYPAAGFVRYFHGKHSVIVNLSPGDRDMLTELVVREKVGELFSKIDVNNCI
ncbi:NAD-dependent deacetylase [Ruminococcus sp. YE71]|uniref:NAD-dependent protein deacylase n=1 Tax=unclassified Ruminococcus TaxID=2608920 RepID=UPI0008903806|nr:MULTISPECIES: NAD-dependent protein deacylase [unclassified Ruminococcus]SDA10378.1 NAD-dependent deacetylase [Ruminococcus sp. YE78]SFW10762.1 NAD-dependent deacetylase [Ruminococcus sp. YE71]